MRQRPTQSVWNTGSTFGVGSGGPDEGPLADRLLHLVDALLAATICVAPFVFGGRHEVGRLVFITLMSATSIAWFLRQSLLPKAAWTRTAAHFVFLIAIALVAVQLVPLPRAWIDWLAPQVGELLPLWSSAGPAASSTGVFGAWNTLSLVPHETLLSLAMLLSYATLFVVLTQRIQSLADVERLLNVVAVAAVVMAAFGLLQYFFSNNRFFWCYEHPHRNTGSFVTGSFMNRNHFASFLVLGIGPLVRWLIEALRRHAEASRRRNHSTNTTYIPLAILCGAVVTVLMAIALSLSRGGAIALFAAAVVLSVIYWRWRLVDARYLCGLAALALALIAVLSVYGYDLVARRLDDFTEGSLEALDHGEGRRTVWAANVTAVKSGWLTGYGAGTHRDVCPVFLERATPRYYTHAENGYLQIATENGVGGVMLLLLAFALCGSWCMTCLARLDGDAQRLAFGAAAAGLVASAVHSLVDFVWYIPACMSATLVLAVCVLRLAQLAAAESDRPVATSWLSRPTWIEMTAVVVVAGGWSICAYVGPAVGRVHWDRYLRAAQTNARLARAELSVLNNGRLNRSPVAVEPLSDIMIGHLERAVAWNPASSYAHLRLAAKCQLRFELAQQRAENAMPLTQIRDAAMSSRFTSQEQLQDWLERAFGENLRWLDRANEHARQAATLSPLQGEAYLHLANLCFLDGTSRSIADAYVEQGLRVRPHDGGVLFEVGVHRMMTGDVASAVSVWAECFRDSGTHQLRIVQTLAGRVPAADFVAQFEPDWRTLPEIWARYRAAGQPEELNDLITYAAEYTNNHISEEPPARQAYIWLGLARMYGDVERPDDALACLEEAYRRTSHVYEIRLALGQAFFNEGRLSEAEAHFRWCLARRPENKGLRNLLAQISKQRYASKPADGQSPATSAASNWHN